MTQEYILNELKTIFKQINPKIDTDKVIEMLDGSIEMAKSLEKLKDLHFPLGELHKAATINPRVHKIVVDEDNADQVIGDFLKKLGL